MLLALQKDSGLHGFIYPLMIFPVTAPVIILIKLSSDPNFGAFTVFDAS